MGRLTSSICTRVAATLVGLPCINKIGKLTAVRPAISEFFNINNESQRAESGNGTCLWLQVEMVCGDRNGQRSCQCLLVGEQGAMAGAVTVAVTVHGLGVVVGVGRADDVNGLVATETETILGFLWGRD